MYMKFVKLAVAAAVCSAFSTAVLADPPKNRAYLDNYTEISNKIEVKGKIDIYGDIDVYAEAGAVTDNTQSSVNNQSIILGGGNDAQVGHGTGNHATGNIGMNVSSGTGNGQGNEVALASLQDASSVFASAQTFSKQTSAVNANIALLTNNTAKIEDSLHHVTGNVGVNVASGAGNLQDNQMASASRTGTKGSGTVAKATGSNQQLITYTFNADLDINPTNMAAIAGSFKHAMGNMGANVTSGYGNLQHNSLSIASAK